MAHVVLCAPPVATRLPLVVVVVGVVGIIGVIGVIGVIGFCH